MQITLRCNVPSATFSSLVTNYTSKAWKTSQTEGFLTSPSYVTTLHDGHNLPLVEEITTDSADSMSRWCDIVCVSLKTILFVRVYCCAPIWLIIEWFRRWPPRGGALLYCSNNAMRSTTRTKKAAHMFKKDFY